MPFREKISRAYESPMFKYVSYEGQLIKNAVLSCIKDWVVESSDKYFDVIKDVSF